MYKNMHAFARFRVTNMHDYCICYNYLLSFKKRALYNKINLTTSNNIKILLQQKDMRNINSLK